MRAKKLLRRGGHWLGLAPEWIHSRRIARHERGRFGEIERFALFVGYPRSGHSLVGSLLDAHPDVAIAHELHVLRYVKYGFSREQIFAMLLENSRSLAARGRKATGYSYEVPGQWQGRTRRLVVIGDKRGGTTIRKLRSRPWLLPRLERRIGLPLRFVHVLRNPFDNVATLFRRGGSRTLDGSIAHYFGMVEGLASLRARVRAGAVLDLRHEDLVADPVAALGRLARFLEVTPEPDWIRACATAVWPETHRSRHEIDWSPEQQARMEAGIARHAFLSGYAFDEGHGAPRPGRGREAEAPSPGGRAWRRPRRIA